jgi:hypothetical protein
MCIYIYMYICLYKYMYIGKIVPITCQEDTEGEKRYRLYPVRNSTLDWSGWLTPRPDRCTTGKELRYSLLGPRSDLEIYGEEKNLLSRPEFEPERSGLHRIVIPTALCQATECVVSLFQGEFSMKVRSSASAFNFQYLTASLRTSSSCLRLLAGLPVPSIFPSLSKTVRKQEVTNPVSLFCFI